eukprot:TRINITY_DN5337_c1_g1_i1.p1 TRINITY_DN5337_c1_g1~~TRINITY_DN5337_c1_g1_i1.p1  ORF type:complete len:248 (+),score=29.41 TRINITY_DN5337_c1_g1_i1:84-827(+)
MSAEEALSDSATEEDDPPCSVTSQAETAKSRDSFESLLERGRSYHARSWDVEAYSFAQSYASLNVARAFEQELQSGSLAPRAFYRHYATMRAQACTACALQIPFIARHIVKQDFLSLRLMFDNGVTHGGTTYHLKSELAERILSFLGHLDYTEDAMPTRSECIDFNEMCPLFRHRMARGTGRQDVALGLQRDTSSSSSSLTAALRNHSDIEDHIEFDMSDEESVASTGSVSDARDRLKTHLGLRKCC